jgi:extracellular elastinolytic metalloproteinase
VSRALVAAAALLALAPPAGAATPARGDFDARARGEQRAGGAALRERLGRFGLVSADPRTGTPRAVAKLDGFLTGAGGRDSADIALDYVREHAGVFRLDEDDVDALRLVRRASADGIEHLAWEQRYRGIPSADTQLRAAVTASGRLIAVTGAPARDLAVESVEPSVRAERAYAAVRGATVAAARRAGGAERATAFGDGGRASLVLYQDGDGARLGWRVLAPRSSTEVYDAIVDARSGSVVRRDNRVDFADAEVFESSPLDPAGQVTVDFAPWLAPGTTTLKGPFARAFVDPIDHVGLGSLTPRAIDEVSDWDEPLIPVGPQPGPGCSPAAPCTWNGGDLNSWQANRSQSATQLFYLVNTFRDHLAQPPIGFDGFRDADRVLAQAMDGAALGDEGHLNNASFLTLPEGEPALLQVHLFSHGGHYDGANDASLVFHEYTHGVSNRLVTDAQGFGALSTAQAGAIGEGTSDFYALDYLVDAGLMADGAGADVRLATYLNDPDGLRLQAIDTPAATGLTYADFGNLPGGPEVHDDGEIWAQTLWDLRTLLGVGPARAVITQALRLAPSEPSFLDMRNAILLAHEGDDSPLWEVFATRGMGYFASTDGSSDIAPVANSTVVPPGGPTGTLSGSVHDDDGRPLAGAHVGIAGHDTQGRGGLGPELADDTAADGTYAITAPQGAYPLVIARGTGLRDARATGVDVPGALEFTLVRDWSSAANGATVERYTGPDNSASGCGPGGLIDDRLDTVWGSTRSVTGQTIVIDLGVPIDVAGVAIDPGAGCGDDASAALRDYEVSGATGPDGGFRALGMPGAFTLDQGGALQDLANAAAPRVRYVRLHAKTAQAGNLAEFLDVAELHVAKTPGSELGPSADTGTAQGVGATAAGLTGTVTPRGRPAQVLFDYGPTSAYGSTVAAQTLGAGDAAVAVGAVAGGLKPQSLYHFRVVALRDGVRYEGGDATFVTGAAPPPLPPPAVAKAASLVGSRLTATRRGVFKVRVAFGATAPLGRARLVVKLKRRAVAKAAFRVRRAKRVAVAMRLSKRGRKKLRPGSTKKVRVELRLPGGEKVAKTMKLKRRR